MTSPMHLTGMGRQPAPWTSFAAKQNQLTRATFAGERQKLAQHGVDSMAASQEAPGAIDAKCMLIASWADGCHGNAALIANSKGVEDPKDRAQRSRVHLTPMVTEAMEGLSSVVCLQERQDLLTTAQEQGFSKP